jgi:hypothetical protein
MKTDDDTQQQYSVLMNEGYNDLLLRCDVAVLQNCKLQKLTV